ncbi:MAG TPA: glycosyltransferase 87 family protein [Methylomirabilota bacterium]|nr:glycosyltransferase 87 family protein [Methylomirabilota bacterium]
MNAVRTGAAGRVALGAIGVLSLVGYALDARSLPGDETNAFTRHVSVFTALFVLYLSATSLTLRRGGHDRVVLGLVLGFGLLFRVAVLPTPVVLSSDVNRYLWDGRVQRAGISPYRYPPSAPELAHLRDETIYPNINRPTKPTVYPPGTQILFAAVTAVFPDSLLGWRLFLLGCEIATAVLLLRVLRRMGRPPGAVIVFAWAPLAVFEGVQAAHVEPALLPLVLLALLWRQEGRMTMAGAAVGAAVLLKLYPAALALAWWRRGDRRFAVASLGVVAAGYLLYAAPVGFKVLGFLPEYFSSAEDFNVGLRWFLTEGIGLGGDGVAGEVARAIVMLLLFGLLGHVLLRTRSRLRESADGIFAAGFAAVAAWLLLAPTALHAWYVLWILPFLAVVPSVAWLWLSGAVALSYLKYAWSELPLWARLVEFVPLYALLIWEWRHRPRTGAAAAPMGERGGRRADPRLPAAPAPSPRPG